METIHRYRNNEKMIALGHPSFDSAQAHGLLGLSVRAAGGGRLKLPDGREIINMSSCSYLGLHTHPAILEGTIQTLQRERMIIVPSSRVRIHAALLDEVEAELSTLFRAQAITTVTASAATAGVLPLIASGHLIDGKPRVMVFDKACHFSMNLIKPICADETTVLTAPHNDLNFIEDVCRKHERVAYVADGFYSTGGAAGVKDLLMLQEKYGLFLFFDDSHGLSVQGATGEGFVRSLLGDELNPLTVVVASLGKGFGGLGGVIMLGPKHRQDTLSWFGGPMTWSQCLAVPSLGAVRAAAEIHRSPELARLQEALRANIRFFDEAVPTAQQGESFQIKLIDIGEESKAVERSRAMLDRGFHASAVFFPIVARGRAALRLMLRADLQQDDILRLCAAVKEVKSLE